MGKKQHQSDKLYLTTTEWKQFYGGHKDDTATKLLQAKFRRLPVTHCSLSLQPFEHPMCTTDGVIFDLIHIVPFIKKYGISPVTGEKLDARSLVRLNFHKNAEGELHCPITYKVFTANSHIVAIGTSGHVYSYEAIEELNLKPKFFKDLLTDEPFTRKDIITLQDPNDLDKFNIAKFHHVKLNLKLEDEEAEKKAMENPAYFLKKVNAETRETLAQLEKDYKPPEKKQNDKVRADAINSAHYSTGIVAAGLTSTAMDVVTEHEAAVLDEDVLRYRRVKKKGYVRLITNYGPLNLELHCDLTPITCENFIKLCKNGYYNETIFHRLIRNFMETIKIITTQIFVDPFEEADELLAKQRAELKNSELSEKRKTEEKLKKIAKSSEAEISKPKVYREGVGKYIKTGGNNNLEWKTLKRQAVETSERKTEESVALNASKKKSKLVTKVGGALSDFSAW